MAFTASINHKTVFGNKRTNLISLTADSAEGAIDSGLSKIMQIAYSPCSVTSAPKFFINQGTTGTFLAGFIGCSGMVAGDVCFLTVFGV